MYKSVVAGTALDVTNFNSLDNAELRKCLFFAANAETKLANCQEFITQLSACAKLRLEIVYSFNNFSDIVQTGEMLLKKNYQRRSSTQPVCTCPKF